MAEFFTFVAEILANMKQAQPLAFIIRFLLMIPLSLSLLLPAGAPARVQAQQVATLEVIPAGQAQAQRQVLPRGQAQAQQLKVLCYNIHHGANREEVMTLEEIGRFIRDSEADLVGLQEVDSLCNRSEKEDQMKRLAEITGMHYAFVRHFAYDGGAYGLGILSKHPVSGVENHRIPLAPDKKASPESPKKSLALLTALIDLPEGKKIRFATVHFALDQPTRLRQARKTLQTLQGSLPVILTGDLNAEPGSEEIRLLEKELVAADPSRAHTFPDNGPVKKIDYILFSGNALETSGEVKVWKQIHHSDHLPFSAELRLK